MWIRGQELTPDARGAIDSAFPPIETQENGLTLSCWAALRDTERLLGWLVSRGVFIDGLIKLAQCGSLYPALF
jgi:hypothetical protein